MDQLQQEIKNWKERIKVLQDQIKALKEYATEDKKLMVEVQDMIYSKSSEIKAKQDLITHTEKDIKNQEIEKERKQQELNINMGKVIKQLREIEIDNDEHHVIKRGIIERFGKGKYGSLNEKYKDFKWGEQLVAKYANPQLHAVQS